MPLRSSPMLFLQAMFARSYARVIWMFRNYTWIFQETILPILSVAAFAYCYRSFGAPEQFVGYVVLGAALSAFWFNVLWSMGAHLYWERDSGNLELYILSPAPMMSILAGMALGGLATTATRAAAILICGALFFDVPFVLAHWGTAILALILTLIALYGMGMMFASLFLLWGREAWHVVNLLQEPVFLLTGQNFPVKTLMDIRGIGATLLVGVSLAIPLSAGMDALRQLLLPLEKDSMGILPVNAELAILAGLGVFFLVMARWALAYLERKAKIEGRLSIRWQ